MENRQSFFVAISSQKGGVAKTTTTISLGASLAEMGKSVLLIDLDPQAHLSQSLGVQPYRIRRTIGDALLNQATLLSVSRETSISGLDLIPANNGLLLIDKLLYNTSSYEYRLKNNFQALKGGYYDYVLMDCPPSFGPLTLNALTVAEMAIVPTTCDYFSAQSLQNYLELFDLVHRKSNPMITYRILITMYDGRTRLSRLILEQYRNKYSGNMFETVIGMDARLRESPVFARPITDYAKNSRSAIGYRALATELLKCQNKTNESPMI